MSKQWYLQDSRQYVGNAVLWWAKDAQGYTCDLRNAHVWTDEQKEKHRPRETDKFWPKDRIDRYLMPVFDMQKFKLIDVDEPDSPPPSADAHEEMRRQVSKYEGANFGKWRTYFREDQRCWRVIGELESIVCDVSGPSAEERAALIADAPELLRQRGELLAALKLISKMAPREDPGGDYEYDTGNPSDHFRAGLILGYYECAKIARDTIQAIAATKGGA